MGRESLSEGDALWESAATTKNKGEERSLPKMIWIRIKIQIWVIRVLGYFHKSGVVYFLLSVWKLE